MMLSEQQDNWSQNGVWDWRKETRAGGGGICAEGAGFGVQLLSKVKVTDSSGMSGLRFRIKLQLF